MGNAGNVWNTRWFVAAGVLLVVTLAAAACGGGNGGGGSSILTDVDPPAFDAQAALDEVTGTEPTDGIDAAVWDELTAELERSITVRGTAAAPPGGTLTEDLAVTVGLDNAGEFTWTYHNAGDYDLNGMVNVSDMTPVGVFYGVSSSDENWAEARYADGNDNGLIDVGDITPIGQHYDTYITGYALEHSSNGTDWETVAQIPLGELVVPEDCIWPRFSYYAGEAPLGGYATVVPVRDEGEVAYTRSTEVAVPMNIWGTVGRDFAQSCVSPFSGPAEPFVAWELELTELDHARSVVIGPNGDIYVSDLKHLIAVSPSGEVQWSYTVESGSLIANPTVEPDGTIHLLTQEEIIQLDASGQVISSTLNPRDDSMYSSAVDSRFGPNRCYYSWTDYETFSAFDLDGNIIWSQTRPESASKTKICFSSDLICLYEDMLSDQIITALDYSGNLDWAFDLVDQDFNWLNGVMVTWDSSIFLTAVRQTGNYTSDQLLIGLNDDGQVEWEQAVPFSNGYPTLSLDAEDKLIWQPLAGKALAYDTTGNPSSQLSLPKTPETVSVENSFRAVPASDRDGNTYYAYRDQKVFQTQASSTWVVSGDATGQIRWSMRLPTRMSYLASPCLGADGQLYVLDGLSSVSLYSIGGGTSDLPDAPQSVQASDGTVSGQIEVSWEPVTGAVEYLVYRDSLELPMASTTETTWTDSNVVDQITYSYSVASISETTVGLPGTPDTGYAGEAGGSPGPGEWSTRQGGVDNQLSASYTGPQTGTIASYRTFPSYEGPFGTVFGSDGKAYCVNADVLYALNPDGSTHWEMQIRSDQLSDPVIGTDGVIYLITKRPWDIELQTTKSIHRVMAISGEREVLWSYDTLTHAMFSGYLTVNTLLPLPGGRLLLEDIYGIKCLSDEGEVLWLNPELSGLSVGADGTIYGLVETGEDTSEFSITALDIDGNELWTSDFAVPNRSDYTFLGSDGSICSYYGRTDDSVDPPVFYTVVYCLSATGSFDWSFEVPGSLWQPAITADGGIHLLSYTSTDETYTLYCFDGATQTEVWSRPLSPEDGHLLVPVVDGEGTLYLMSRDTKKVMAFDSAGNSKWDLALTDDLLGNWINLSLSPDGRLYVSGYNGSLLVIE